MKPAKGVTPNFTGVPGVFVPTGDIPSAVIFGGTTGRKSPYDALLHELREKNSKAVLCFGELRARASVYARAKKLGMKVEFGEYLGKLYVRLISVALPPTAPVKEAVVADAKLRKRSAILDALRRNIATPEAIAVDMRAQGHDIDAPIVRSMLKAMQADGTVKLARLSPEKWEPAI